MEVKLLPINMNAIQLEAAHVEHKYSVNKILQSQCDTCTFAHTHENMSVDSENGNVLHFK